MAAAAKTEVLPPVTDIVLAVEESPQIVLLDTEKFDQFYERVKSEADNLDADPTTKKGREEIKSMAFKIAQTKSAIEKARLGLTSAWRAQTDAVNAAGKDIKARLDALQVEVRRPVTEWEDAEKARVDFCQTVIADLKRGAVVTMDDTAADVRARGKAAWEIVLTPETFGDMLDEAQAVKDQCVATLKSALDRLVKEEAAKAELEKLRAEAAEREAREQAEREAAEAKAREEAEAKAAEERRIAAEKAEADRIARAAQEAEERAKAEAERAANEAAAQRQREHDEALAAERRRAEEAEAAIQAERDRIAKEEAARKAEADREAAAQAKREADQKHRATVKTAAKQAFMTCGADEETAKKIVLAIIAGEVPAVSLRF